ncbi:hypothetical protein P280DRAFT_546877 [Massarina eburnea CBS 473.64]|uniref:Tat pathway signal sequence n=1 Tax=Massarina eburnea CBS 473.64 TaxID=1395130 RepID=A0A6A6S8K0_9PLEO|nr:hypothetical protein P280DRAFT_546877 [Massarina eburnea CBS 473.64]
MSDNNQASYSKLLEKSTSKPFHDDSDTASVSDEASFQHERFVTLTHNSWEKRLWTALLATVAVVYTCGSLAFMVTMYRGGQYQIRGPDPPYTPVPDVRYVVVNSADGYDEDLQGFPSKAHDKAWLELVTPALSRASHKEMELGREDPEHSVAVGDENGGYMVSLGVYHELHCLRRLKMYLHKEHYYPKLAPGTDEDTYELNHLNHCLEAIRLSLMCAGNTALYSFQWPNSNEKVRKPKTKTNSQRTCVDWEGVESWAVNRSIGLNPTLERPVVEVDHSKMDHSKMGHDQEKSG